MICREPPNKWGTENGDRIQGFPSPQAIFVPIWPEQQQTVDVIIEYKAQSVIH